MATDNTKRAPRIGPLFTMSRDFDMRRADPRSYMRRVSPAPLDLSSIIDSIGPRQAGFTDAFVDSIRRPSEFLAAQRYFDDPSDTTRKRLLQESQETYGYLPEDEAFDSLSNFITFYKQIAGQSLGFMLYPLLAGGAASLIPAPGTGTAAFLTTGTAGYTTEYLIRKARMNQDLIDQGKMSEGVTDDDKMRMLSGGFGSALLDFYGFKLLKPIGQAIGLFGKGQQARFFKEARANKGSIMARSTTKNFKNKLEDTDRLSDSYNRLLASGSVRGRLGKGALGFGTFEAAQEVAQTAIERWAVGEEPYSEEALEEFINAGTWGFLLGAPIGSVANLANKAAEDVKKDEDTKIAGLLTGPSSSTALATPRRLTGPDPDPPLRVYPGPRQIPEQTLSRGSTQVVPVGDVERSGGRTIIDIEPEDIIPFGGYLESDPRLGSTFVADSKGNIRRNTDDYFSNTKDTPIYATTIPAGDKMGPPRFMTPFITGYTPIPAIDKYGEHFDVVEAQKEAVREKLTEVGYITTPSEDLMQFQRLVSTFKMRQPPLQTLVNKSAGLERQKTSAENNIEGSRHTDTVENSDDNKNTEKALNKLTPVIKRKREKVNRESIKDAKEANEEKTAAEEAGSTRTGRPQKLNKENTKKLKTEAEALAQQLKIRKGGKPATPEDILSVSDVDLGKLADSLANQGNVKGADSVIDYRQAKKDYEKVAKLPMSQENGVKKTSQKNIVDTPKAKNRKEKIKKKKEETSKEETSEEIPTTPGKTYRKLMQTQGKRKPVTIIEQGLSSESKLKESIGSGNIIPETRIATLSPIRDLADYYYKEMGYDPTKPRNYRAYANALEMAEKQWVNDSGFYGLEGLPHSAAENLASDGELFRAIDGIESENINANNLKQALREIAKKSTGYTKQLANRLAAMGLDTAIRYGKVVDPVTGEQKEGSYNPKTDTITLDPEYGANIHTLLHEVMHAATLNVLRKGKILDKNGKPKYRRENKLYKDIQELFNISKNYLDSITMATARQNVEEFVAEVFVNPDIKKRLEEVSYKNRRKYTLYERLVNIIKRILRIPIDSVYDQAYFTISDILEVPGDLSDTYQDTLYRQAQFHNNTPNDNLLTRGFKSFNDAIKNTYVPSTAENAKRIGEAFTALSRPIRGMLTRFQSLHNMLKFMKYMVPRNIHPFMDNLDTLIRSKESYTAEMRNRLSASIKKYIKLRADNPKDWDKLEDIVLTSTIEGVEISSLDPSVESPATTKKAWLNKIQEEEGLNDSQLKDRAKEWDKLRNEFKSIKNKEVQKAYYDIRKIYNVLWNEIKDAVEPLVDSYLGDTPASRSIKVKIMSRILEHSKINPYFALTRFGQYRVTHINPLLNRRETRFFETKGEKDSYIRNFKNDLVKSIKDTNPILAKQMLDFDIERDKFNVDITMPDKIAKNELSERQYEVYKEVRDFYDGLNNAQKDIFERFNSIISFTAESTFGKGSDLNRLPSDSVIKEALKIMDDNNVSSEEQNNFKEILLQTAPEVAVAGNFRKRKNVLGAERDLIRSLASAGDNHIKMAASLKYNRELGNAYEGIEAAMKADQGTARQNQYEDFEMTQDSMKILANKVKFTQLGPNYGRGTRWWTAGAFHFTIGANISSALVQLLQMPYVINMVGNEYGFQDTGKFILENSKILMGTGSILDMASKTYATSDVEKANIGKYWGHRRITKDFLDGYSEYRSFPSLLNYTNAELQYLQANKTQKAALREKFKDNPEVIKNFNNIKGDMKFTKNVDGKQVAYSGSELRDLVNTLKQRDQIGKSPLFEHMEMSRHGIEAYGSGMTRGLNFFMKASGATFNAAEQFQREVTALTVFRLEMQKSGNVEKAVKKASDALEEYHGPVTSATGAPIQQSGLGKSLTVFKQYAMTMYALLFGTAKKAFTGDKYGISKKEQRIAQKQLLGIFGVSFLLGGGKGLPGFGLAEFIYDNLFKEEGEDDLEKITRDFLGEAPIDKITGLNFENRAGYGNLIMQDSFNTLDNREDFMSYIFAQLGGPSAVYTANAAVLAKKTMNGEATVRDVQNSVPTAIKNLWRGVDYYNQGVRTTKGDLVTDDVSAIQALWQAFGLVDNRLATQLEKNAYQYKIKKEINERTQRLVTQLGVSKRIGDFEAYEDIMEKIREHYRKYPETGLSPRSVRRRLKLQEDYRKKYGYYGAFLDPKLEKFLQKRLESYEGGYDD